MSAADKPIAPDCNCLALRQATRHVTQFYDQLLAPNRLRATFALIQVVRAAIAMQSA